MAYLAPIHRSSSVRHAIKLNLLNPEEECLVLAKANRVEIWVSTEEGLVMLYSKAIYGLVSMFAKIRPLGATTDHLLIGTIRFQYFTVVWNPETRHLDTIQQFVDLTEKYVQESHSVNSCLLDPTGRHIVMELFQGVLSHIGITKPNKKTGGYLKIPEQARLTELRMRSMTFLYTESDKPKIAFLYEERRGEMKLATYRLLGDKSSLSLFDPKKNRENELHGLDPGASHLIPVPKAEVEQKRYIIRNATTITAQMGGVIIVGETRMTYLDDESKAVLHYTLEEASIFVAWERYDDTRYLLADEYGQLYLLTLNVMGAVVMGIDMKKLGKTSRATTLVYLGNEILFVGSHVGDSQVVALNLESNDERQIRVLQTMANIAPILDFAVMDMGGREGETQLNEYSSGQARLVTCSGAHQDGSLRSVRSGVGLDDIGILADMEDVQGLFALRSSENAKSDDTIVVSYPTESRVFRFDSGGEIEEVDSFRGLSLNLHSILAMNLPNGLILQVTAISVSILGPGPRFIAGQWSPPSGQIITAASANESYLLLSSNGTTLVSLDLHNQLRELAVERLDQGDQVACIHVSKEVQSVGVVGFWKSGSLSLLRLSDLQIIHSEDLRRTNNASIPRDIILTQVLPKGGRFGLSLFVAMEDGIVLTFNVDKINFSLSGRKSIILGTQQARLQALPGASGLFNIFAICQHPSLIYASEGSVVYSAVTAEGAVCVCSFDNEAYPGSVVVATAGNLKISQIDTERRTHVQTLPMGKTVRRIAYSSAERAFGIGCIKRELIGGEEIITNTFSLVEEVLLSELGIPFTLGDEFGPELVECVIRADLPITHGGGRGERFIVGTSFLNESVASQNTGGGRILFFSVDSNRSPFLIHSHLLKGACRRVAVLDGKIVAALVKTVVIYDYIETTEVSASLEKRATYRTSTCPIDLEVNGNTIVVADLMKSISLLEFVPGKDGLADTLQEIARHHEQSWSTGVINIGGQTFLETDADGNILVLERNINGVTMEDRKSLNVTSEISLGEMVNKIQPINTGASRNAIVTPKAFLATTEGSIYLFSTIAPSAQDLLIRLQTRMASLIQTLGNIEFNSYRSFKNSIRESEEPFRFVDGELVERFLDASDEVQEEICVGLGPSVEDIRNAVEELRRLR